MPLDLQVRAFLEELKQQGAPPFSALTPQQAREAVVADVVNWDPPEPVSLIEERSVPGPRGAIPIRVYVPFGSGPFPVLVYYHGGGWVLCDISTHQGICTTIANAAGCVVVSVDYRLAPEHKYPAAAEDAYAVLQWVAENAARLQGDPRRVAVAGDSAGGNLAAAACLMARDRAGRQPTLQLLIYPVTDCSFDTPSYRENAEGYGLTLDDMQWFWGHYLTREEDGRQPYASPLRAADLSGLPPALVLTAEYDPLRDEGEAYAARLRQAAVQVSLVRYEGLIHAFIHRTNRFDKARAAVADMAAALRAMLAAG
jgi:acetyl esterase